MDGPRILVGSSVLPYQSTTEELVWLAALSKIFYVNNLNVSVYITSGKNHFHEMNGDVGMARWK